MLSPIGIRVQQAVCALRCTRTDKHRCDKKCTFPQELRHLVMVLAVLANRTTGRGLAGQGTIARAMGVSVATLKRYFVALAERDDSPVIVERSPRMKRHGRGRTSDEYQLWLRPDLPLSSEPVVTPRHGPGTGSADPTRAPDQQLTAARPTAHSATTNSSPVSEPLIRGVLDPRRNRSGEYIVEQSDISTEILEQQKALEVEELESGRADLEERRLMATGGGR